MERCGRCEAEGRKPEIKGKVYHISVNGLTLALCNLCYTEIQDEVGEIIHFTGYENEEN